MSQGTTCTKTELNQALRGVRQLAEYCVKSPDQISKDFHLSEREENL